MGIFAKPFVHRSYLRGISGCGAGCSTQSKSERKTFFVKNANAPPTRSGHIDTLELIAPHSGPALPGGVGRVVSDGRVRQQTAYRVSASGALTVDGCGRTA